MHHQSVLLLRKDQLLSTVQTPADHWSAVMTR